MAAKAAIVHPAETRGGRDLSPEIDRDDGGCSFQLRAEVAQCEIQLKWRG